MRAPTLILHEAEIRELLDRAACIRAVEDAFTAYATGRAELPDVIHLGVPERRGEVHVKAGYLHGSPFYAVKVASGFPENPALGLPANDGMVVVFDAQTGVPAAILFDNGFLTDVRTAAAGAVAARHLAPEHVGVVAVIGTGTQARLQPQFLAQVRTFGEVRIWGRRREAAERCAGELRGAGLPSGDRVLVAESAEAAVTGADVVITVTASRVPLVQPEWIQPGALILAVGSDGADKQELDPGVLARADRVVADSLLQCRRIGEIHHALTAGVLDEHRVTELGAITAGRAPGRRTTEETIVCDLTGVGVQDVAVASLLMQRVRAGGDSGALT